VKIPEILNKIVENFVKNEFSTISTGTITTIKY